MNSHPATMKKKIVLKILEDKISLFSIRLIVYNANLNNIYSYNLSNLLIPKEIKKGVINIETYSRLSFGTNRANNNHTTVRDQPFTLHGSD